MEGGGFHELMQFVELEYKLPSQRNFRSGEDVTLGQSGAKVCFRCLGFFILDPTLELDFLIFESLII